MQGKSRAIVKQLKKANVRSTLPELLAKEITHLSGEVTDTTMIIAVAGAGGMGKSTAINCMSAQPDQPLLLQAVREQMLSGGADRLWDAGSASLLGQLPLPNGNAKGGKHVTKYCTSLVRSEVPHITLTTFSSDRNSGKSYSCWMLASVLWLKEIESRKAETRTKQISAEPFACPRLPIERHSFLQSALQQAVEFYVQYLRWLRSYFAYHALDLPQELCNELGQRLTYLLIFHSVSRAAAHTLQLAREAAGQAQASASPPEQQPVEKLRMLEFGHSWAFPSIYCIRDTPGYNNKSATVETSNGAIRQWFFEDAHAILLISIRSAQHADLSSLIRQGAFRNMQRTAVLGVLWHEPITAEEQLLYLLNEGHEPLVEAKQEVQEAVRLLEGNMQILPVAPGAWDQRARHLAALRDNCVLMPFANPRTQQDESGAQPFLHLLAALRQRYMSSILDALLKYIFAFTVTSAQLASGNVLVEKKKHLRTFDKARKAQETQKNKHVEQEKLLFKVELMEIVGQDLLVEAGAQHSDDEQSSDDDYVQEDGEEEDEEEEAEGGSEEEEEEEEEGSSGSEGDGGGEEDEDGGESMHDLASSIRPKRAAAAAAVSSLTRTGRTRDWIINESEWRPFILNMQKFLRSYLTRAKELCYDMALSLTYEYYTNHFNKKDKEDAEDADEKATLLPSPSSSSTSVGGAGSPTTSVKAQRGSAASLPSNVVGKVSAHASPIASAPPAGTTAGSGYKQASVAVGELLKSWANLHGINAKVVDLKASEDKALFENFSALDHLCRRGIQKMLKPAAGDSDQVGSRRRGWTAVRLQQAVVEQLHTELNSVYFLKWERMFEAEFQTMLVNSKEALYEILSADSENKDKIFGEAEKAKTMAHELLEEVKAEWEKQHTEPEQDTVKRSAQDPAPFSTVPLYDRMFSSSADSMDGWSNKPGKNLKDDGISCVVSPSAVASASARDSAYLPAQLQCKYLPMKSGEVQLQLHMQAVVKQQLEQYSATVNERAFDLGSTHIDYLFPIVTAVYLPEDESEERTRVEELLTKETFDGIPHLHLLLVLPSQEARLRKMFVRAGKEAHRAGDERWRSFEHIRASKLLCILPHDNIKPSSLLDVGKHIIAKFGFVFSWRLSQVVHLHYEVGMLRNSECTRGRLLLHMQHIVVKYFIYVRGQLYNAVQLLGRTPELLAKEWGKLMRDGLDYDLWAKGNGAILAIAEKDGVITEGMLEPLAQVIDCLMPNGKAKEGLPKELEPVLSQMRLALRQWGCVAMYGVYNQKNVRWRFYGRYPDFHNGVRGSYEIHSLVLDHTASQSHTWFMREKHLKHQLEAADPYPDLDAFYNAIKQAEQRFMRAFTNSSSKVTMMILLGAFAIKPVSFNQIPRLKRKRASKAKRNTGGRQQRKGATKKGKSKPEKSSIKKKVDAKPTSPAATSRSAAKAKGGRKRKEPAAAAEHQSSAEPRTKKSRGKARTAD